MYTVGDKVAHPMHGVGMVERIVTRQENTGVRQYYLLRLCVDSMTVLMPCDCCEAMGLRPIITTEQARQLLGKLAQVPLQKEGNWNQRYRGNIERLKTGDPWQVAMVIRTLQRREKTGRRSLPTGERKMLNVAKKILVSELSLALGEEYQKIEHIVEQILV